MKEEKLTKFEFDILQIALKYHPEPVSATEMAFELREKGYDLTMNEVKEMFDEAGDL